ncbi:MAG TPA: hypothetical protein VF103_08735, partial [Polyangiaceae bacterium]
EVRAGELMAVSGRVEERWNEEDYDEADEGEDEHEGESPSPLDLPFEDTPLVYYDADLGWFRRTCFTKFGVRDSSGIALVELGEAESTLLERRKLPVEGAVERWLDEQRDDESDPIPADSGSLAIERIRKGDLVAVVGTAEQEGDGMVFRARPSDPTSLLVGEGSFESVVGRLKKRIGRTRAFALGGGLLVAVGGSLALWS